MTLSRCKADSELRIELRIACKLQSFKIDPPRNLPTVRFNWRAGLQRLSDIVGNTAPHHSRCRVLPSESRLLNKPVRTDTAQRIMAAKPGNLKAVNAYEQQRLDRIAANQAKLGESRAKASVSRQKDHIYITDRLYAATRCSCESQVNQVESRCPPEGLMIPLCMQTPWECCSRKFCWRIHFMLSGSQHLVPPASPQRYCRNTSMSRNHICSCHLR